MTSFLNKIVFILKGKHTLLMAAVVVHV